MTKTLDIFGIKLFSKETMKQYLPHPVFKKWQQSVSKEEAMDRESADAIAHAMKIWAIEQGATHYSHWFHPMTGASAEKHDAFIEPDDSGKPITRFSGKNLIKGETDGSSFPNGGLRQTFEARGYTYWDVTSPAFIRGHVLFIPSIFISYHGESLDEKAPLIKAMEALSTQATRLIHALGDKSINHVRAMVGLEQEYFLIKRDHYMKRDDLLHTGRTLFGQSPSKDQEQVGHYFGAIPSYVIHFMEDVNTELWKLGIYSKVEHNEVSPSQFEIVVIYGDANVAIDQNMLVMQTLERIALKHDLVALMHEKPFQVVNGSGKHNNFSLVTDTGLNLFDPGDRPHENIRFLIFVAALIKAVDTHSTLLRFAASSPGNDYRLGASEAPPAIISMYVGDVLDALFKQLESSKTLSFNKDIQYFSPLTSLSGSPRDYSDRNRTSPFAFTGNKFEFRMPGGPICSAFVNTCLCATLAETLGEIADELQPYKYVQDVRDHSLEILQRIIKEHKRILFNGDGYHQDWIKEAAKRGLPNIAHTIDAAQTLKDPKTIAMFKNMHVFNDKELDARFEINTHQYCETQKTESLTMISMIQKELIPSALKDYHMRAASLGAKTTPAFLEGALKSFSEVLDSLYVQTQDLQLLTDKATTVKDFKKVQTAMLKISVLCNTLESVMSKEYYPFPTYTDMLFK